MTNATINNIFSSLVHEVSMDTFTKFKEFLSEKLEVDSEMQALFEEFGKKLTAAAPKTTKKRGAVAAKTANSTPRPMSAYNLYIKNKMAELKAAGHTGNLMKLAVAEYNKDKAAKAAA